MAERAGLGGGSRQVAVPAQPGPVADQLSDDLAGTGVVLLPADERARLVDRRTPDVTLRTRFDQFWLAPGFGLGEEHVGTNAIGTALRQASPVAVAGGQHFAEVAAVLACAAAPITDPGTGIALGAVGLACAAQTANPLMLPLAKRAGPEIERRRWPTARCWPTFCEHGGAPKGRCWPLASGRRTGRSAHGGVGHGADHPDQRHPGHSRRTS